jgi:hypothetical protein
VLRFFVQGKIMFKRTLMASAIATLFSTSAYAVTDAEWAALKDDIRQMKAGYEARIAELETRVKAAEQKAGAAEDKAAKVETQAALAEQGTPSSGRFNPDVSLILQGKYSNMDDVGERFITGFIPAGHDHGGERGFSIDHTELTLSASVDQLFKGYANFALADEEVEVEEAWFQTLGLGNGFTLRGGRFLSALGYQNEQHPHAWDFATNNLVYQALFGEATGRMACSSNGWRQPTSSSSRLLKSAGAQTFPAPTAMKMASGHGRLAYMPGAMSAFRTAGARASPT